MLQTHKYHINIAISGTCIRQPFTISYMLKFICMLKARIVGNAYIGLTEKERQHHTQILMRAGCIRIRKSKKAAKSNISCINFIKNRLTEAEGGESRGGGSVTELVAEMEIREGEVGKGDFSVSVGFI
ncbi:hypothetical protein T01_1060 [Trichinella spiralis]|uniref:Uncharacterized protein n=1 Tax=Trichinella spiralis TaxID=6334 RepID=A0A0V1BCN7_TRISP|nr:hypothetical protein T01_1060 [Trichinella spiralis]